MRFKTLDATVRDILATLNMGDDHYMRVVRIVRGVMEDLNLTIIPNVESRHLLIEDNLTVVLPPECLGVTKAGVIDEGGRIRIMGVDNTIRRDADEELCTCGNCAASDNTTTQADISGVCPACTFYGIVGGSNMLVGEFYGYRVDQFPNGRYRYNAMKNILELGSGYDVVAGDKLLVEYKRSVGDDIHTRIPSELYMLILYRTTELLNLNNPGVSQNAFVQFRRQYSTVKTILNSRHGHGWLDKIREAIRAGKY